MRKARMRTSCPKCVFRCGLAVAGVLTAAAAPVHAQGSEVTIRTDSWIWSGGGGGVGESDWFNPMNWNHGFGPILQAPTGSNLKIWFGPVEYQITGVFQGFYFDVGGAVLDSDYGSPQLNMYSGVDTSITINSATYTTPIANIGKNPNNSFYTHFPEARGTSTLTLNNAVFDGSLTVGVGDRDIGVLNFNGNSDVTGLIMLAQGLGSHGTLNIGVGALFDSTYQKGSGIAVINNSGTMSLSSAFYASSSGNVYNGSVGSVLEILSFGELSGELNNAGLIKIGSGAANAVVEIEGPVTLRGGGGVVMLGSTSIIRYGSGNLPNDELTNVDHTIRGAGTIQIYGPFTNTGVVRAEGGQLDIYGSSEFDNSFGQIQVASDGVLRLTSLLFATDVVVGNLVIEPGGRVLDSDLINCTLAGPGPLVIEDIIEFAGVINNPGIITFGDNSGSRIFEIEGPVTLQGGGEIVLAGPSSKIQFGSGNLPNDEFINTDNTIRGTGTINLYGPFTNSGIIRAEGGQLTATLGSGFDNTLGQFQVASDGVLRVTGVLQVPGFVLGDLAIEPGGRVLNSSLKNCNLLGPGPLVIEDTIEFAGLINNTGLITFGDNTSNRFLEIEGPVTLQGGGELVLMGTRSRIMSGSGNLPGDHLINLDHTIRGSGSISTVDLDNEGTIRAEGGVLTYNGSINGSGSIEVNADAEFRYSGAILQQNTITVTEGGVFQFDGLRLEVTEFIGDFTHDWGVFAPGASPAISTVSGDYTQLNSFFLDLEIELAGSGLGQFDQLQVGGDVTLIGDLDLVLLNGYVPAGGDEFLILQITGARTGEFRSHSEGQLVQRVENPAGVGGVDLFITYLAGDGNDVALQAVEVCTPDVNQDGFVDNGDIGTFIAIFLAGNLAADFNGDGFLDNGDISAFIGAFLAGC